MAPTYQEKTARNDPFDLLGIEARFDLDLGKVERTHRELSRALHPDRFANAPPGERREALSRAVAVNEAWRVLRDPVRRAEALLALRAREGGETENSAADAEFLMDMMELREELATAKSKRDLRKVRVIAEATRARARATEARLAESFAAPTDERALANTRRLLGELRYHVRMLDEADAAEDELDNPVN